MITLVKDIKEADGITHNGTMHADEVFATAFLSLLFDNFKVARVSEIPKDISTNAIIYDIGKEKFDVFSIALWKGLEDMMSDVAQIGMIIAVRGRLIANKFTMANYDFKEVIIYGELIEILNKYF